MFDLCTDYPMLGITIEQRRKLRALAHALSPVVIISQNGLSESVLKEIERSLKRHELIKIRVFSDDRKEREHYLSSICEQLGASPVQHIGKLLVIWRPSPENQKRLPASSVRKSARRICKRQYQGSARH